MADLRIHRVARRAYTVVDERRNADYINQYGALAYSLPGMILQNGLAQATGFLLAKSKKEHLALLTDLNEVLKSGGGLAAECDQQALHQHIIDADLQETMRLTRLALEASGWIKRYVQGTLRIDATGESEQDDVGDQAG